MKRVSGFSSEQHDGRLRSDPAGLRQTELQPGPAAGPLSRPGEDEAVAADGGGRPLDDGVHALLLRPAEVETGSDPRKPRFLIGPWSQGRRAETTRRTESHVVSLQSVRPQLLSLSRLLIGWQSNIKLGSGRSR